MSVIKPFRASRTTFLAAGASAFATIGSTASPAKAAQFEFKCASQFPRDHPTSVRLKEMWAAVERESGGRLKVQFFSDSILGNDVSMFSQLRLGAIQLLFIGPALGSVVPVSDISYLGYVFKDSDDAVRVMDGPLGNYIRDEVAAKGMNALPSMWDNGMRVIGSTSHAIRTPDDMRGFKVKVVGRLSIDLFKRFGAIPVEISLSELYTALQTKLVDGEDGPLITLEISRLYEVDKYVSLTNHSWTGMWVIANGDAWKSLPPDLQAIVERNNRKYSKLVQVDTRVLNLSIADKLTRRGMTINRNVDQTPFRARLQSYNEYWASSFGSKVWDLLQSSVGRRLN